MRILIKTGILFILMPAARQCPAQHYVEARGASTEYRYLDWNYTFPNSAMMDVFMSEFPGATNSTWEADTDSSPSRP